ncbi:hypothetical protein A4A49_15966 [Nicotiana attenuata]|uniref:Uncharacterized protein n=1 Tax=Nicotiana attenuata TaxID=49451 RepID=A0A314LAX3_NICAT|nr:hypothetical protein A4A49_15966 [Nicotiana attenuata]
MRERKKVEEKTLPKRVKVVEKKDVLPLGYVTLGGRTPVTRGKSKTTLEKDLGKSKKKKKDREGFRLIVGSDVEEVDLVSGEELAASREEKEKIRDEIASLKKENMRLKEEMKKEQKACDARFDMILELIHGESSSCKEPGFHPS